VPHEHLLDTLRRSQLLDQIERPLHFAVDLRIAAVGDGAGRVEPKSDSKAIEG
jgi:hypothetical protein